MNICKYCKNITAERLEEPTTFHYKNQTLQYNCAFLKCSNCDREYIPKKLILTNETRARAVKKKADGLLSSSAILVARKKLGLTQDQAAQVFGGGKNAFSKYERDEVTQSIAMDKLIRLCFEHPAIFRKLCSDADVFPQRRRSRTLIEEKFKGVELAHQPATKDRLTKDKYFEQDVYKYG